MTGSILKLAPILIIATALIIAVVCTEYRSAEPEWVAYSKKGIELAFHDLRAKRQSAPSPEAAARIDSELAALAGAKPEIIEIRPFQGKLPVERCLTCHKGIEDVSPAHPVRSFGCVVCHGGNGGDLTVNGAHQGLRGGRNPASLEWANAGCGSNLPAPGACHAGREHALLNRTENTKRSVMATNAGIIGILRFQWGVSENSVSPFGVRSVSDHRVRLEAIPLERDKSGALSLEISHFRKFCASCHLWGSRGEGAYRRFAGCPACHAYYNATGTYEGLDPTIRRDEPGHAARHGLTHRISNDRCRACHNRSARIGLNYEGLMESSQYGTPYVNGGLNDRGIDDRYYWRLVPDIHHEKGMGCIDCHTGQDTMGDGQVRLFMKDQVEIRCEDCHGAYARAPKSASIDPADPYVKAAASTGIEIQEGAETLLTSKGRPLLHIRNTEKGFMLKGKLDGKDHKLTVITGKKGPHSIVGHERLECDSCHSAWSPQCFGCHQILDMSRKGRDHLTGAESPGRWAEGRNYFRYERNILGINARGAVGVIVPGCQVFNTRVNAAGKVDETLDSKVMPLRNGMSSMAFGPTHPHTTRKETPSCADCHLDEKTMGLGETAGGGRLTGRYTPLLDPAAAGLKLPYPLDAVIDPSGRILQGMSHKNARGFNAEELRKIRGIGPCIACHHRYDDPVWLKPGPYRLQPACIQELERIESQGRTR